MKLLSHALGTRTFRYTRDHVIPLPENALNTMRTLLGAWQHVFPREDTYPMREWSVPTIIARFDGVLSGDDFFPFEIENTPAGVGYMRLISDDFAARFDTERRSWPPFKLVLGEGRADHDDALWVEQVSLDEARRGNDLLIIRDGLWRDDPRFQHDYAPLTPRSMTPLSTRLSKRYGATLGWWREVSTAEDLPWETSFVVKARAGARSETVFGWGMKGHSTRSQIAAALRERGSMYLQPFKESAPLDIDGIPHRIIIRPYFAYSPERGVWEPLGGMWVARPMPNVRIHWASDSVSGPLGLAV